MEIWYNWAYSTKILTRNTKNKWSLYYNITSHTIFKITVIQFHTLDNICWIILCVCLVFSYHFPNLNLKLLWSFTAGSIGYGCWWERKWQIMPYVDSSCIIYHFFPFNQLWKSLFSLKSYGKSESYQLFLSSSITLLAQNELHRTHFENNWLKDWGRI